MSTPSTVKERPILFSGPMVKALLDGRKTMMRRVVRLTDGTAGCAAGMAELAGRHAAPLREGVGLVWRPHGEVDEQPMPSDKVAEFCPHGGIGDRLWVKETWSPVELATDMVDGIRFRADGAFVRIANTREAADAWVVAANNDHSGRWRSSRFMPRWASRITLEITGVKVERLHKIPEADAISEGAYAWLGSLDGRAYDIAKKAWYRRARELDPTAAFATARAAFAVLWDSINGKRPGCDWESNCWVWAISFRRVDAPREGKE